MTTTDNKTKKLFMRVLAVLMCAACLITSFSSFFITIADDSPSVSSVKIIFNQGSTGTTLFSDTTTEEIGTNVSGCLVVPETYFNIYNETAEDGELAITLDSGFSTSNILDCETFYFDSAIDKSTSWAYSFTGWHIASATDTYIPEQTVFQPGDVITPDILSTYASSGTLTLEALWGKCYFIQNAYTSMVYADSSGYKVLDITNSSGATGASDSNIGNDPKNPVATIDGLYKHITFGITSTTDDETNETTLSVNTTKSAAFVDHDAYSTVIMLTGDLDYYKDNSRSTTDNYYNFYGYDENSTSSNNGGFSASSEYVSATYKSLQATRTYSEGTATITHNKDTKDTKYTYYYKGYGSYNQVYSNMRLDNILFKRINSESFGTSAYTSEFQLYYPSGDTGVHYFETTARYNVYTENDVTTYVAATSSKVDSAAFSSFRTANHEYIVLNGGQFNNMELYWASNIATTSRYWYIGRLACINNYITVGCTNTGATTVYTLTCDATITVTGGKIGYITGSGANMYFISVGDRTVNVYGDGSAQKSSTTSTLADYEYSPYIGNLFGGGRTSPLYGDVTINAQNCNNLVNVYGGGQNYSATTYGNVTVNITNCTISEYLYGGGQYANVEVIPEKYIKYSYDTSTGLISSTTDNYTTDFGYDSSAIGTKGKVEINLSKTTVGKSVYGSGMGETQQLSTLSSEVYSKESTSYTIVKKQNEDGTWTYTYDYPSDWSTEPTFPTYDSTTGYILIGSYKYITWSTASPAAVNFRRYDYYAYLSLATVQSVEINITDDSLIYGDVYGGGSIAKVLGDTAVNITDSEVRGTVYGGGDGATTPSTVTLYKSGSKTTDWSYTVTAYNSSTGVPTEVTFTKGYNSLSDIPAYENKFTWSSDTYLLGKDENGNDYNGIDYDKNLIYSANATNYGTVGGGITVTISGNSKITTVYGGGNQGAVTGNITVNIKGGEITTVYGGCNAADVGGNITVNVTGGTIGTLYGGNNESGTVSGNIAVNVSQEDGTTTITTLYGGGNEAAYSGAVTINVTAGTITNIYGGGLSAAVGSTSVTVTGATVSGSVFGGGYAGEVTGAVTLSVGSSSTVGGSVYGGGYSAAVGSAAVTVTSSTITGTLYGGGEEGAVNGAITVTVTDGKIATVYGGGNKGAVSGAIGVTVSGSSTSITTLFGGCNAANVGGNITVQVTDGTIGTLYGGNNASGTVSGDISVTVSESSSTSITTLYGGGNVAAYSGTATTSVSGGTIGTLYGGGLSASVGTAKVNISGGTLTDVYGGGEEGDIGTDTTASSTTVTVTGGSIGNVYGGGYNGSVYGTTTVSISDTDSTTTKISGSVYGAGYGADTCVTKGTTVTVDLTYNFTVAETLADADSTSGKVKTTITGNTSYPSVIEGSVYGGGNLGTVGIGDINTSTNTASISTAATTAVNIVSGHIKGNVYGGGYGVPKEGVSYNIYMGTVFGSTTVKIGDSSSTKYIYIEGDIFGGGSQSRVYAVSGNTAATVDITSEGGSYIALGESVFGGGERGSSATTNASVPTTIGNVSVNITGNSASTAATIYFVNGGVYGDGNLCLVSGTRTITITNLITGTGSNTLKTFYSLQRADTATLSNSKIVLLGATDLVAEGDSTTYSINRIDALYLNDGSTIKLDQIVNYLGKLVSDVYTGRNFINGGYNGTNSYNTGVAVKPLDSDAYSLNYSNGETSTYITAATNGTTFYDADSGSYKYPNTVCVANGLSLEIIDKNGNYGAVTGLFTLSLLNEVAGEGGGFVYASIADSTGDFICTTKFEDESDYMEVADDVGGYTGTAYTYYYWFIAGSTINYTMEVTGYIGSDVSDYDDSGTVTRHSDTRYYVLNSVSVGSTLENAIVTNSTYTLATSSSLSGQQIAIEVKLGDDSLGFLYYDSTNGWGLYNSSAKYGTANGGDANANTLLSTTVTSSNDTLYFVLHKSSDAGTEISEMTLTITIEIYGNGSGSMSNDPISGTTNKLVIAGTVNIARLGPSQAIYKTSGKNYAGVSEDSSINITAGSSFTVQYQTKYIPAAFSSSSGTMTWALSTQGYEYYMDASGNYMTINTSTNACTSISSTLTYSGGTGTSTLTVYGNSSSGYYYYTSYPDGQVEMTLKSTFAASSIPSGTKITMIDLTGGSAEYYYYICDDDITSISLSSFYKMGTTTTISDLSSYPAFMAAYYSTASANTLVSENLIFIFDFEDTTTMTGDFSVQLQHIYTVTNASYGTDIMDYVKSPTEGNSSSTYERYTPTLTKYTISTEAGYKLSASFGNTSYYDLDTATLTVTISEDTTNINTRLSENEYAIKIELLDSSSNSVSFPVGMEFKCNGVTYAIASDGKYVIIPVKDIGTYNIYITNELYSLMACYGSGLTTATATFKVTLYSAPDANYYNNIEWGSATASYTIDTNPTYALSVTTTIDSTTYSQVLANGETLKFGVTAKCSDTTSSESVIVTVLKKNNSGAYEEATLSDLFTNSNDSITASTDGTTCNWTISDTAEEGTYRLVFTYGDRVEYLNVIVYSST